MKIFTLIGTASLLIFNLSFGNASIKKWQSLNFKSLIYELPIDWKIISEIYGLETTAFGPIKNGEREVISFISNSSTKKLDEVSLLKHSEEYKKGRESYILKKKGTLLNIENPEILIRSKKNPVIYKMSVKYRIENVIFNELSFLIECPNATYHIKAMKRNSLDNQFNNFIYKVIDSIRC